MSGYKTATEELIARLRAPQKETDYSPLMAAADVWGGGNGAFQKAYTKPLTQDERLAAASKLELALEELKNRNELTALKALTSSMKEQRPLPEVSVNKISEFEKASQDAVNLGSLIEENKDLLGPISGLASLNPFDVKRRQLRADIDRVKQGIGKTLEGGVLRKEDEDKYKKILATIYDKPETASYKMKQLNEIILRARNGYLSNLQKANFAVQNFEQMNEGDSAPSHADIEAELMRRGLIK